MNGWRGETARIGNSGTREKIERILPKKHWVLFAVIVTGKRFGLDRATSESIVCDSAD